MAVDQHPNFVFTVVATAPSPATSGTTLTVPTGKGALFAGYPFNAVVWPSGNVRPAEYGEIVRVTGVSTDTLTIVRNQEGSGAKTIRAGDTIAVIQTAKTLTDIEGLVTPARVAYHDGWTRVHTHLQTFSTAVTSSGALLAGEAVQALLSGTAAQVTQTAASDFLPGVASLATGTTATGRCAIIVANWPIFFVSTAKYRFAATVWAANDSDGTDTHEMYVGLANTFAGVPTSGIYFSADKNATTNWQAVTNNAGTATTTDTGVSCAAAGGAAQLEIDCDGTNAIFTINGTVVATQATNKPADFTGVSAGVQIIKSAGTTTRLAKVDRLSCGVFATGGNDWA